MSGEKSGCKRLRALCVTRLSAQSGEYRNCSMQSPCGTSPFKVGQDPGTGCMGCLFCLPRLYGSFSAFAQLAVLLEAVESGNKYEVCWGAENHLWFVAGLTCFMDSTSSPPCPGYLSTPLLR